MRARIIPVACIAVLIALMPAPASAEPDESTLEADLEKAISAVADAEDEVDAAKERQTELADQIEQTETELAALEGDLDEYALFLYTEGDLQATAATLSAENPDQMVDAMTFTGYLADQRASVVNDAGELLAQLEAEQDAQADAVDDAEKALDDAEKAAGDLEEQLEELQAENAAGPGSDGGAAAPDPVGGTGSEGCTEDDPTTDGCITPRTLHVLNETQEAGFDHYVSCYRSGGSGEHPQGRACDWAAAAGGFEDSDAQGSDKDYGDRLAAWYVNNADALSIEYVIWYREFWSPSSGWKSYSGADGSPAGDHTNHVHVSVR